MLVIHTGGLITLADGQTVEYDWLVLALGAETATFGIPGVRELALPFCTYDDAVKVHGTSATYLLISNRCSSLFLVLLRPGQMLLWESVEQKLHALLDVELSTQ